MLCVKRVVGDFVCFYRNTIFSMFFIFIRARNAIKIIEKVFVVKLLLRIRNDYVGVLGTRREKKYSNYKKKVLAQSLEILSPFLVSFRAWLVFFP